MRHIKNILLLLLVVGLSSCIKEKDFPNKPSIEYKDFVLFKNDSADCYITFKDGDGDVGIFQGDTTSVDNLKMKYLYKASNGAFVPYDATFGTPEFDTLFYSYRIPNLTPDGQYKALDGEIKIKLRSAPLFNPAHKVVKFEITLSDRAGNKSNMVETKEIVTEP